METKTFAWRHNEPIVAHYLQQFERVSTLFEYEPEGEVEQRVEWLDQTDHIRAERTQLVTALTSYNERIQNHPSALANIAALAEPQSLVIVGGQQAGLLTGPKLVIYKAVTIIQAAKRESERLGRPVVPVFWIAGEDHDFAEVNHTYVQSANNDIHQVRIDHSAEHPNQEHVMRNDRPSISRLNISQSQWAGVIAELEEVLLDTEFKGELIDLLREVSEQAHTLSDSFGRLMASLFGRYGLVLIDAADEALRRIEVPMFEVLIEHSSLINEALKQGKAALNALGYEASAEVRDKQANLFVEVNGSRTLLFESKAGFTDRKGSYHITKAQLRQLLRHEPVKFSNNVFTRPLMQEFLFPVLQTVLGPGEIAYWSLLRQVFRCLHMRMPIIIPRLEFTIVERSVQKHMSTYELSFEDVVYSFAEKKETWLKKQDELGLLEQFADIKAAFGRLYDPLLSQLGLIHPGIAKLGETNKQKILEQIDFLKTRSYDAFVQQHEAALRQLERIERSIIPLGNKQERVYNIFAYLNKYGLQLIDELVHIRVDHAGQHTVIYK